MALSESHLPSLEIWPAETVSFCLPGKFSIAPSPKVYVMETVESVNPRSVESGMLVLHVIC